MKWKWKSLSCVQLFATPWTMDYSPWNFLGQNIEVDSLSLLQGIFPTQVSCIAGRFSTSWVTGKTKNTGVGSLSLLQGIFLTPGSNPGLQHCRQILYQLSYKWMWIGQSYFPQGAYNHHRDDQKRQEIWNEGGGSGAQDGVGWGAHVHPKLIHVNVRQKPPQYYKVISL